MSLERDISQSLLAVLINDVPGFKIRWFGLDEISRGNIKEKLISHTLELLKDYQTQLVQFVGWWAERGHKDHDQGTAKTDWRHCPNPLCLSLLGTLDEFKRPTDETPPVS